MSDRARHFPGGREGFIRQFVAENQNVQLLHQKLEYLFWGAENFIERIAKCANPGEYKIHQLADRGVAELYGWINSDDAPIANQCAVDTMRHLDYPRVRR